MKFYQYHSFDAVPKKTVDHLYALNLGTAGTMKYRIDDWRMKYKRAPSMPHWFLIDYPNYRWKLWALQYRKNMLREKFRNIVVAEQHGDPIGWCMTDDFDHINLFVNHSHRGQGIATTLAARWIVRAETPIVQVWNDNARIILKRATSMMSIHKPIRLHD